MFTITFRISSDYKNQELMKEGASNSPHYSLERHLNLNGCDTSLIWTYVIGSEKTTLIARGVLNFPYIEGSILCL